MIDVVIRAADDSDASRIDAVESAAFGPQASLVIRLMSELRRTGAKRLELVAEEAGVIAGHVLLSRAWVDAPTGLVEAWVLSPLAVLPERQGRGIGRALIEQAMRMGEESGVPAVFLEGDPAYYSRSGFVAAIPAGFLSPSSRIPDSAFQVRLLTARERWLRGALIYPEAFWIADAVGPR
ncbi:N-acetyltransferase [Microbacteriaceae bacterium VKM Ac-2855]|nr:N-acetyltransferase [Microbacteriaceae bacterium VKM Ac-2855]